MNCIGARFCHGEGECDPGPSPGEGPLGPGLGSGPLVPGPRPPGSVGAGGGAGVGGPAVDGEKSRMLQ